MREEMERKREIERERRVLFDPYLKKKKQSRPNSSMTKNMTKSPDKLHEHTAAVHKGYMYVNSCVATIARFYCVLFSRFFASFCYSDLRSVVCLGPTNLLHNYTQNYIDDADQFLIDALLCNPPKQKQKSVLYYWVRVDEAVRFMNRASLNQSFCHPNNNWSVFFLFAAVEIDRYTVTKMLYLVPSIQSIATTAIYARQ